MTFLITTGTGLLVLTMVEIDTTGSSYYGEQGLHFVGIDGESSVVPLGTVDCAYQILLTCHGVLVVDLVFLECS